MANSYFKFKQFTVFQERTAFKVGTDGVLLGACAYLRNSKRVLDIGTGTGLIALMLAQRCDAEIVGIEPDPDSFAQACENVRLCNWSDRIKIENCELQNYLPSGSGFDTIVTNPPYFIDSLVNPDEARSKARHNISLNHKDILEGARRLLKEGGTLQVIFPYAEGNVFIAKAQSFGFYCNDILKIKPVPSGTVRRIIIGLGREKLKVREKFLTIEKGNRHDFTEDYINLTKDFYLKF